MKQKQTVLSCQMYCILDIILISPEHHFNALRFAEPVILNKLTCSRYRHCQILRSWISGFRKLCGDNGAVKISIQGVLRTDKSKN